MTQATSLRQKLLAALPILAVVAFSAIVYFYITPEAMIEYIGLQNAYFIMFAAAFLAGLTTFNTVPYYSVLLILATAGLNPVLLGLSSAVGVMCGDSISYLIGRQGAAIIPGMLKRLFDRIYTLAQERPRIFPLVCFLYGAFSPLSNDFVTIPAGLAHIPYLRVIVPLALGNIVFNVSLAYLAVYAVDILRVLIG